MYRVFFDGACKQGLIGYGFVVYKEDEDIYSEHGQYKVKSATNNVAEYTALIKSIKYCVTNGITHVQFIGDSLMVINQMLDLYKVLGGDYVDHYKAAKELIKDIEKPQFKWVPREKNKIADKLSKVRL